MISRFILLFFGVLFGSVFPLSGKDFVIDQGWEYLATDDGKRPPKDDPGWQPVEVGRSLRDQGIDKQGVHIWYRVRFDCPDHTLWEVPGLYLGPVELFDQVSLNGKIISGDPKSTDVPVRARLYSIPRGLLKEKNNHLSIRVITPAGAGLYHEPPRIGDWLGLAKRKENFERIPRLVDTVDLSILGVFLLANIIIWLLNRRRVEFLYFAVADAVLLPFLIIYSIPWLDYYQSGYFGGGIILAIWTATTVELIHRLTGFPTPRWLRWCYLLLGIGGVLDTYYYLGGLLQFPIHSFAHILMTLGFAPIVIHEFSFFLRRFREFSPKLIILSLAGVVLLPLAITAALGSLPVHPLIFEYVFFHGANILYRILLLASAFLHIRDLENDRANHTRRAIQALESEQSRLARELHDGIASATYGMQIKLKILASRFPEGRELTHEIITDLGETAESVRQVSYNLKPAMLEELGLIGAIRQLAIYPTTASPITPSVTIETSPNFPEPPPEIALHLFRIVQEARANAIRHGRAKNIRVSLAKESKTILLKISDDGIGITAKGHKPSGNGLSSMKDRAAFLGGTMKIHSLSGSQGTVINVTVPDWTNEQFIESLGRS